MNGLTSFGIENVIERAAETAHEINRAFCFTLGDHSQVCWDHCEKWQKESAMAGVRTFIRDPDISPENLHIKWMEHKEKDGWTYGPKKDPKQKKHPCMVLYAELPTEQRTKDALFRAAMGAFFQ